MTNQTFAGNVTADPEFRQNRDSRVANFTIAVSSRKLDKDTNQWVDEGTGFIRCAAWNGLADAVMANLRKGSPVIVEGPLRFREWVSKDGNNSGTAMELDVKELGISLRFHDVQAVKRTGQGGGGGGAAASHYGQPAQSAASAYGQQPQQDPWGQAPANQAPWGQQPVQQQAAPPAQQQPPQQQQQAWGNTQAQTGWANPGANFDDAEAPF